MFALLSSRELLVFNRSFCGCTLLDERGKELALVEASLTVPSSIAVEFSALLSKPVLSGLTRGDADAGLLLDDESDVKRFSCLQSDSTAVSLIESDPLFGVVGAAGFLTRTGIMTPSTSRFALSTNS